MGKVTMPNSQFIQNPYITSVGRLKKMPQTNIRFDTFYIFV